MSSGNIQIKIQNPGVSEQELLSAFDQILNQQTKALRTKAAHFLNEVRKKRHKVLEDARNHGYVSGYTRGSKEGKKSFNSTSKHVRAFRKYLEQVAISMALETLNSILPNEKAVQNRVIRKVLQELKPRLRDLTFIKCIKNPKSKISSQVLDEISIHEIPTEYDDSIPKDHIKFVTPSGELTICSGFSVAQELQAANGSNGHDYELFC